MNQTICNLKLIFITCINKDENVHRFEPREKGREGKEREREIEGGLERERMRERE